jgi:hypothetical protein
MTSVIQRCQLIAMKSITPAKEPMDKYRQRGQGHQWPERGSFQRTAVNRISGHHFVVVVEVA